MESYPDNGGYAQVLNRFFARGDDRLRTFFENQGTFSKHVLEKKWGGNMLFGHAAAFGVRRAEDLFGTAKPSSLFARQFAEHEFFVGRADALARLSSFLNSPTGTYLFLTAPDGFGKTSLLVNWLRRLQDPSTYTAAHFISRRLGTAAAHTCLTNLCRQLAIAHGTSGSTPNDDLLARASYSALLSKAPPEGHRILVVVDGLDEALPDWEPDHTMFPHDVPPRVKVVFSARRTANRNWLAHLHLQPGTDCTEIDLPGLSLDEVAEAIRSYRNVSDDSTVQGLAERIYEATNGDPFYVADLLRSGVAAGGSVSLPIGHSSYLRQWWREACQNCPGRSFEGLMAYLALARQPLARDELLRLSSADEIRGIRFEELIHRASRYVDGTTETGYRLAHERIVEFIKGEMSDEIGLYRSRLADFCLRWSEPELPLRVREYVFRHAVAHLVEAGRTDQLIALLGRPWIRAKIEHFGHSSPVLTDIQEAGRHCLTLPQDAPNLARLFTLAWLREQLSVQHRTMPLHGAEQVLRARLGQGQRALSEIEQHGTPVDRLIVYAEVLVTKQQEQTARDHELFERVMHLSSSCPSEVVEAVALRLLPANPQWALALAQSIPTSEFLTTGGYVENPNRARCVFQIFRGYGTQDANAAARLCESLDALNDRVQ